MLNRYSKKNITQILQKEVSDIILSDCIYNIEEYRNKQYFKSKNLRISKLPPSNYLAELVVIEILKAKGELCGIQGPACNIARKISKRTGMQHLEAVKCAMELISIQDESALLVMVHANAPKNNLGTLAFRPKVKPSMSALELLEELMYTPPVLGKAPRWSSVRKCENTDETSCVLGNPTEINPIQHTVILNMLQNIEWELDNHMLRFIEKPNKPIDTQEKLDQFTKMAKDSRRVYKMYKDKKFHFVWKYDKRGRVYSCGYHINLQSTDYKKALLNFARKEVIK